jgi:multiple sugar transport system ATP-binding protein
VFLFDEPLSNLDAKLRIQMRAEIRELHQRLATTTIYVTHDQIEAMTMADKIVVMNGGHIEQIGAPLALYDRPKNMFVAGFIGAPTMNFLDARVRATGQGLVARVGETDFALPQTAALTEGQPVTLGIRPEHTQIAETGLPAEVSVVEPTGSETHLLVRAAEKELTLVVRDRLPLAPGQGLALSAAPETLHLFDPETGARID